jgi:phenylalanyl-tRNA synthetase alpha chain
MDIDTVLQNIEQSDNMQDIEAGLKHALSLLKTLSPDEKKRYGQRINDIKRTLQNKNPGTASSKKREFDLTIPGMKPKTGCVHPISQATHEITRIFEHIGFTRVRYPEVDWEWYPFDSLNMPKDHPARDEWETFLINEPYIHPKLGRLVLTPHTSNGQVREMQYLQGKPPIRMINIARCARRQEDVTHTEMFHQFEGLVVDKGISIQHLKGTIDYFAEQFFGKGTKSRIRPFHFQFTEPSFEVDFSCSVCGGTGEKNGQRCKFCKSGWHEVGGAGMVHPNVLTAGGIDPNIYTGFAFGWGIERTYTLRNKGINDIRQFYANDMRFLSQFT